jgi:hypothetical protein
MLLLHLEGPAASKLLLGVACLRQKMLQRQK